MNSAYLIQLFRQPGGLTVEQNRCDGIGTGTLILSFVTGLAAGIAAALLIASGKEKSSTGEEQEDQLFI